MAAIPVRNFATLVGNFAVGVQGRAKALVDFSVGSVMRAVAEATSDVMLWFQSVVVYLLTLTRAGTSKGDDLDTWYADWFFFRLPAKPTTGTVTFARFSADNGVIVPVGVEVATGDGSRIFAVYADQSNPAWDPVRGCYVVPAGVFTVDVPVAAVMPANTIGATAWNVAAGQVNTARSTVEGLDTLTNAAPFTNGVDRESDDAFAARFPDYIAGLSRATPAAIRAAVGGVQQGLQCTILNDPGHVTVTVDDGTGSPSTDLVARVLAAVTAVGAGGVWLSVLAPIRVTARVEMTVVVDPAYDRTAVGARVTNALGAYIDGLGLGAGLPFTALSHVAYGIPGVTDVTNIMLNGKTASIPADRRTTIKSGAFIVAPSA